jgi:ubiquitin-conjugating enzyme E2 variant
LLEELDKFEKGSGDMNISAGLVNPEDIFLTDWNCSILGVDGTAFQERFYELRVTATDQYPDVPPVVKFKSRCNMACVNQSNGVVDLVQVRSGELRNGWHRDITIEMTLKAVRAEMQSSANKRLPQPPDGQQYP